MTKKILASAITVMALAAASTAGWQVAAAQQGAAANGGKPQGSSPAVIPMKVKRPPGLRGDVQQQLDSAEEELTQLASVVPPEKFAWRPAPGVRSFGEVILHVAGGNYEVGSQWGMKIPAGVNLDKIEQQGADKGNAIAAMRVSFEQVRESIAAMSDADVDKPIKFFGSPGTVRRALIATAMHAHEHLGQAIAYARMNGIVPPWTAAEQKQAPKPKGR